MWKGLDLKSRYETINFKPSLHYLKDFLTLWVISLHVATGCTLIKVNIYIARFGARSQLVEKTTRKISGVKWSYIKVHSSFWYRQPLPMYSTKVILLLKCCLSNGSMSKIKTSCEYQNLCGMWKICFSFPIRARVSDNFKPLEILMKLNKFSTSP